MKYTLNERNIDAVCKEAYAFLVRRKTNPKDLIHTKLSIEEVLLTYLSAFGSDVAFSVDYGGGLTKNRIRLTAPGPSLDPFASTEASSDEDLFLSNVLSRMGQRPKWKYARGVNTILDFAATATNVNGGQCILAVAARSIEKSRFQE